MEKKYKEGSRQADSAVINSKKRQMKQKAASSEADIYAKERK